MNIRFRESDHKYFTLEEPDKPFVSVSGLFDMIKPKFDSIGISERYASKPRKKIIEDLAKKWNLTVNRAEEKWKGVEFTPEVIREIWEEKKNIGLARGTKWHKDIEQKLLNRGGKRGTSIDGEYTVPIDIKSLGPGHYIELMIPYIPLWLIGTADRVEIHSDKTFTIRDWKGFPLDTEIPTLTGFKQMKDIQPGDSIFDGEGNITKVKNVSSIHYNPCYKITFDTNESIICDFEHRWEIHKGVGKKQNQKCLLTTEEINNYYAHNKTKLRIKNTSIQIENDIELPIDPYVLGCWLGDGNSYFGRITNMNPKIWKEVQSRGYHIGEDVSNKSNKSEDKTIFGLGSILKELNLIKNKHIPDIYFQSSKRQRLDLLRGFMDTDGYYNTRRKRCVMETTQEWQMKSLTSLIFSLGYKVTVMKVKKKGFGKIVDCYHICFSPKDNPFLHKNENYLELVKNVRFFNSEYRYIKNIEKVDSVPTKCIEVESPYHTYLVTRNYLKTHNSDRELLYKGVEWFDPKTKRKKVEKLLPPLSHLDNVNGIHYNVKESLYIYFLESYGFKFREGYIDHVQFDENDEPVGIVEYPIEYLKSEVRSLLNWYKNKQ